MCGRFCEHRTYSSSREAVKSGQQSTWCCWAHRRFLVCCFFFFFVHVYVRTLVVLEYVLIIPWYRPSPTSQQASSAGHRTDRRRSQARRARSHLHAYTVDRHTR